MTGLSNYAADAVADWVAGQTAMPALAARYLALFTGAGSDAGTGFTEVSGGAYARVQVAGSAATSAATASGSTLHFSSVPSWITAGMTVTDTSTSGVIPSGTTVSSVTGTTVTLSAAVTGAGVGSGDTISFSAFAAASGTSPSSMLNGAAVTFPQATASWGTVVAFGLYDASTGGNLIDWDWLGLDPWVPFSCSSASPGVLTAIGITANSTPTLANGANAVVSAEYGGTLPTGLSAGTVYTVAGLSADTFNLGTNTSSTGSGMVRQITEQPIAANVTASFAANSLQLTFA